MDADGFEDDYEEEVDQEEVLFGIEEKKKGKKAKKVDELDELFEQGQGSDEDIYATEDFDSFEGAKDD